MGEDASPPVRSFLHTYGPAVFFACLSICSLLVAAALLIKTTQVTEPIRFVSGESTASAGIHTRTVLVDIAGEVEAPGVYSLPEGSRVEDALRKAGGFTDRADPVWIAKSLNRASVLSDGAKLYIPTAGAGIPSRESSDHPDLLSINSASASELDRLPGVGEVTARKILEGRPYQRLEELLEKGILKASVFDELKSQLTL